MSSASPTMDSGTVADGVTRRRESDYGLAHHFSPGDIIWCTEEETDSVLSRSIELITWRVDSL